MFTEMEERDNLVMRHHVRKGISCLMVKVVVLNVYTPGSNNEKWLLWIDIENVLAN